MTRTEIFEIWAPDAAIWSRWAKPVLFAANSGAVDLEDAKTDCDLSWCPQADGKVALVLDLPGAMGVYLGMALARIGYRPVPLYNAAPPPSSMPDVAVRVNISAVDVLPILSALVLKAGTLSRIPLPPNAPPAFLLDANRQGSGMTMKPGEFDNRSISLTTDFPSANFFASQGIRRILFVQQSYLYRLNDLTHSLYRWQDAGLELYRMYLEPIGEQPQPFQVSKPLWYAMMFQRALASLGLYRAGSGGFGGWVPEPSSGG